MTTYISILRGINVSGKNLIKMDLLRKSYENLGLQHVKSYVQSGNVIFCGKNSSPQEWEQKISQQIEKDFGSQVPVIVLTLDQLKQIIKNQPFSKEMQKDSAFLHVTFLSSTPESYDLNVIKDKQQTEEEIAISGKVVYLYCPHGYGRTKLTNSFLENKLKVCATTRNWKTTNELLRLADSLHDVGQQE